MIDARQPVAPLGLFAVPGSPSERFGDLREQQVQRALHQQRPADEREDDRRPAPHIVEGDEQQPERQMDRRRRQPRRVALADALEQRPPGRGAVMCDRQVSSRTSAASRSTPASMLTPIILRPDPAAGHPFGAAGDRQAGVEHALVGLADSAGCRPEGRPCGPVMLGAPLEVLEVAHRRFSARASLFVTPH